MGYYLYQLEFDAPVHFGYSNNGGGLEQISKSFTSDSLFSAICSELAQQDELDLLNSLKAMAAEGDFKISDLFPYLDADEDLYLFLPKPFIKTEGVAGSAMNLEEAKQISAQRKAIKKQAYIRISELPRFMSTVKGGKPFKAETELSNGSESLVHRVNCRTGEDPLPYYVNQYSFPDNAGLYLVAKLPDDMPDRFQCILESLGYSGIGGKRSAGYGRFHLADDYLEIDETYADTEALQFMLEDEDAKSYMAISSVLPKDIEVPIVSEGQYQLKKSSGFTNGIKRDSVYMIAAGSCLKQRISGEIIDIAHDDEAFGHPVWRYGKGMFIGLPG